MDFREESQCDGHEQTEHTMRERVGIWIKDRAHEQFRAQQVVHRMGEMALLCAVLDVRAAISEGHTIRPSTVALGIYGAVLRNS